MNKLKEPWQRNSRAQVKPRGEVVGEFGAQKAEQLSVIGKDGTVKVQPRGEVGGHFGAQKTKQLSNTGRDGKDEGIEDVWAEVQSGDEEGRVEVQPRSAVFRDVLHVMFGTQRAKQLSRIGNNLRAEVKPRGEVVVEFGDQMAEQLSVIGKGGTDGEGKVWERGRASVRDMRAEVKKAERLSDTGQGCKVEVQPRKEVIRRMLQVVFGAQPGDNIVRDMRDGIFEAWAA